MMDYDLLGFIKASKYRKRIMRVLEKKMLTTTEISNKLRAHRSQISRSLAELTAKGVVEILTPDLKKGRVYALTELGKKCLNNL